MEPTCNSSIPSQPIMADHIGPPQYPQVPRLIFPPLLHPLALSRYAAIIPEPCPVHQATNYHFPHSSNAEVNWIEHYKEQVQKSGQECAHYQKFYKRVSNENQSLKNQISIFEQKIRKQEELDQQLSNNEELAEKLQLEVVQFRIDNASLKDEGKVLKKTIGSVRDKKQVEILNFKLDQLYIDNALQKAEVASLKKPIAKVQEKKYMDKFNLELDHLHTENTLLKAEATLLQQEIVEVREEARKEGSIMAI
jgi:hypothetical protein